MSHRPTTFLQTVACVCLGVCLATTASTATDARAAQVLKRSAAVAGEARWASLGLLTVKADIVTSGLTGTLETLFDAGTGLFRNTQVLGPASGGDGYDGSVVWLQDAAGQTLLQGSEDAVRGAVNAAYQNARGYWHPDRFPADIAYLGRRSDGGQAFDVLRVTPAGGRPIEEWFGAHSHLLERTVEQAATQTTTTFLGDYRPTLGAQFAYRIRQTTGEAKYDVFVNVTGVDAAASAAAAPFAAPESSHADFGFTNGGQSTTVPFELVNNHMYVEVRLNGKPYVFLFDTGGRNVVTPTTAKELGLATEGALKGNGVGEKAEDFGLTTVAHLEVGDAHLDNQPFVVIALESFGAVEGRPITGVFGYEVFKRFIVRTDYEHREVTLWDPASYHYAGTGTRVPFTFADTNPVVAGEIDGLPGKFTLDTGSRSSLDLSTPFVREHDLVRRWNAGFSAVSGWGVGGAARSSFTRLKSVSLGGIAIPETVVGLSEQRSGAQSDIYLAGNVGAGILKRFTIVWDYPHQQIYFEPNGRFEEPEVFDRAGLWANLGGAGFVIVDVTPGGPAEQAGLKAGDEVRSVDGRAAGSDLSLPDFRQSLKRAPGTPVRLEVVRAGNTMPLTVTLRELL